MTQIRSEYSIADRGRGTTKPINKSSSYRVSQTVQGPSIQGQSLVSLILLRWRRLLTAKRTPLEDACQQFI